MDIDDTIKENAETALKSLKKVIASGGNRSGTFYLVKGKKAGESGIAIFLQSKDKKGAKVKASGKVLRKASTGNKFCIGTLAMENKKLIFRILEGALSPGVTQKTLKADFQAPELKKLGNLLKKALVVKGEAEVIESSKGKDNEESEVFEDDFIKEMKEELLAEAKDDTEREQLVEIFDVADEEGEKIKSMESVFEDLLTIDEEDDPTESKEAIIEIFSALYSEGFQDRDQLLKLSENLAKKNVDLSEFENRASVGSALPEPMRTQVLLAQKMMITEELFQNASKDFPGNIVQLNDAMNQAMNEQSKIIADALAVKSSEAIALEKDGQSFLHIQKWIAEDNLFKEYRSPLQKSIKKVSKGAKIDSVLQNLSQLEQHIVSSIKIQGCDNYIQGSNIRSVILPFIKQMREICIHNQKQ